MLIVLPVQGRFLKAPVAVLLGQSAEHGKLCLQLHDDVFDMRRPYLVRERNRILLTLRWACDFAIFEST